MSKRKSYEDYNYTCRLGLWCLISLLFLLFLGNIKRTEPPKIISPLPIAEAKEVAEEILPTPTPTLSEEEQIIQEINNVFGEHSDKAMRLLTDPECHENLRLDPEAVNDNTQWGGVGRDCGVFQINNVYHPYTCEQMKDWKLNINYAYRMFKNDGYKFTRWTCGVALGI
jgi:hypothetical protein